MVRWFVRGGAVALVAAFVAVSMVAAAVPARAADPPVKEVLRVAADLQGKVKGASPGIIRGAGGRALGGAACLGTGGVGCLVLGGISVGIIAYDTRDYWMPWLEQHLTPEGGEGPGPTEPGSQPCYSMAFDGPPVNEKRGAVQATWVDVNLDVRDGGDHYATANDGKCFVSIREKWKCSNGLTNGAYPDFSARFASVYAPDDLGLKSLSRAYCQGNGQLVEIIMEGGGVSDNTADNGLSWSMQLPPDDFTFDSEVRCKNPQTGEEITLARQAEGWIPVAGCPEGYVPVNVDVGSTDPATGQRTNQGSYPLNPTQQDELDYPLCVVAGVNVCQWRIDYDGQTCKPGDAACESWTREAEKEPDLYECFYGPYRLPIAECGWMERAYDPAHETTTGEPGENPDEYKVPADVPNTDGDPDTWTDPAPPTTEVEHDPKPEPSPSPSESTGPVAPPDYGSSCGTIYSLGPVQPELVDVVADIAPRFNIDTVGGYRESDPYPDHPSGLAADFMTGSDKTTGSALASYAVANAAALGIDYVMWDRQIWSSARSAEGWRDVPDRGGVTANHEDHVHITVTDVAGTTRCDVAPDGDPDTTSSECFPSGWSAFNPVQWVLKPTKCALDWAFVPDGSKTKGQVNRVKKAIGTTGGAEVLRVASDRVGELGGDAGGCKGPGIRFDVANVDRMVYPFNACTEPVSTAAHYAKALTSVVLVVGGGLALVRAVASGFGFNFSTRAGGGGTNGD